jgi:mRNA interferase RelE/StbE
MATYRLEWKSSALREIRRIDPPMVARLLLAIEGLQTEPFPAGCIKLQGSQRTFRSRVGDYRIIYEVYDSHLVVVIVRVRHRKDAYRG